MTDDQLAVAIAETTPAMLWMGDAEGRCLFLSRALRRFWGVDPHHLDDFDWSSTLHPDDVELLAAPFGQAMAQHTPFSVEARYKRADGTFRIMRTEANPRFDQDGRFQGMTGVNTDVTEQRDAEEQARYLMGELNHRTKNLLTVVQAIARNTARSTDTESFLDTFSSRLAGLAASNDLLVSKDWSAVSLGALVGGQFDTIGVAQDSRVTFEGPLIQVCPQHAQTIGMALHELATNSLKYGALCDPAGRLTVSWDRLSPAHWRMEWREHISREVPTPEKKGFGHALIVDMVERAVGGEVQMEFGAHGLLWALEVRS
ncbi:MAG: PAS domain-containing protein [Alphaproteobacteria bacterium]|nr:PAS domain-containing protein [Alphaproteobacteria bacterium]MBU1561934.1 PAS domain-containing protein [Alphaproteobacteria bacterium]MBU2304322.1 PAS domain-containing protein [Alphaproteobacteria bacterium]MBU2369911.1 PAS domain-containing protein [Alphaproteobacteria bacterium]